jgi:hypothetical protein
MTDWRSFLAENDAAIRRNDLNRGLTFSPDPKATTRDIVAEYMDGFGWNGVGAREVTGAVGRDPRGVKRALAGLVEDGHLRIEEQATRGPKASKRKVYYSMRERPEVQSLPEPQLFEVLGSRQAQIENEHGPGGGRVIPARLSPDDYWSDW